ncbi:hypothetical protein V8C86DRAFT_3120617 [Haematococcus lacustris]
MDLEDVYQLSSQRAQAKGQDTSMLLTCQHPTACSSVVQPASHLLLISGVELHGPGAAGELQQRLASHPDSVVLVSDPAVTEECAASSCALAPGDLDFTAKEQLQLIVASQAVDPADYTVPALARAVRRRIDYVLAPHQLGLN